MYDRQIYMMLNAAVFATKRQLLILSTEVWTENSLRKKYTTQEYLSLDVHHVK